MPTETTNNSTIEAFAVYSPDRAGAMTYVLTKDQTGRMAAYAHNGHVDPLQCAHYGTKLNERTARQAFIFSEEYRR